jgi:hypothetical protein
MVGVGVMLAVGVAVVVGVKVAETSEVSPLVGALEV